MPCAEDWKMVIPRTPVKVNPMKLNPAARPRLSCRVPPISDISRKGKTKVPMSRVRSRVNLTRSRDAIAAIALSSFTGQDPKVGVLEGGGPRPELGQRRLQQGHYLGRAATLQANLESAVLLEPQVQAPELIPQAVAVGGVDYQRLFQQLVHHFLRRSQRHHPTSIHDANPV